MDCAPELKSQSSLDSDDSLAATTCVFGTGRWFRSHCTASKYAAFQKRIACQIG